MAKELEALQPPPLAGKSVLDIGAFDGFYSFEAQRRGEARVVSLDLQVWELETRLADDYQAECAAQGVSPAPPYRTECLRWRLDRDGLPGKRRFDLARRALGSRAEAVEVPGTGELLLCEFFPGNELNGDYSNWWSPNIRALEGLVRAAGFKSIEVVQGPPSIAGIPAGSPPVRYRAMVHARKA